MACLQLRTAQSSRLRKIIHSLPTSNGYIVASLWRYVLNQNSHENASSHNVKPSLDPNDDQPPNIQLMRFVA